MNQINKRHFAKTITWQLIGTTAVKFNLKNVNVEKKLLIWKEIQKKWKKILSDNEIKRIKIGTKKVCEEFYSEKDCWFLRK